MARSEYDSIADALGYIERNAAAQPSLEMIAKHIGLSPFHFQHLFTKWAGISPKRFLQFITVERAKDMLAANASLLTTSVKTGLSGPSRLHDLFVSIEGMTPGEYKNGGAALTLNYDFAKSPFGRLLIASTLKGVAYLAFAENDTAAYADLKRRFPKATLRKKSDAHHKAALRIFKRNASIGTIKLHLKGTDFQLKVWRALLSIPPGGLATYAAVAKRAQSPTAHRAVGAAIGQNPVAFLIPCHRVIRSSGAFGNYHWGTARKTAMIGWEAAQRHTKAPL